MKRPEKTVERSFSMLIASYYLARCGAPVPGGTALPPSALNAETWKAAFDFFYDAMGDGRTPSQFRNSMKNARDTFDILFDNGRVGWIDRSGIPTSYMSESFRRVHEEWENRTDEELERLVLGLQSGMSVGASQSVSAEVRTEGGQKVYASVRYERRPDLREYALRAHGYACMACGFNFEDAYGEIGARFAEVHHMMPLAEAGMRETNALTDLAVLCSNCHRMVHRRRGICLSLEELKDHLRSARPSSYTGTGNLKRDKA
jgi:5-methylcytosine-specific restriction enzyme A